MTRKRKWFLLISFLLFVGASVAFFSISQQPLNTIHQVIKKDYQSVSHISASQFSQLSSEEILVFDVREPEEFEVSHIGGAIQVSPDIDPQTFIEDYGELLKDKKVVFYCSVGRRSSALANKLGDTPFEYGATSSQNLIGGVFSWVNQDRELSSSVQGSTKLVHPYNKYWGRLIKDQSKLSYTPE
jgi:rhodanese-related sulfurtransferase